jgi:hypothetical protein
MRDSCPEDINWEEEIKYDPSLRKEIDAYHPNGISIGKKRLNMILA